MPIYLPGGYSDSESDPDDYYSPRDERSNVNIEKSVGAGAAAVEESWLAGRLKKKAESGRRGESEEDYDTDVREILDTGDLELVEQLVTGAGVDVNHCLTSHYSWSLALYAAYRVDHRLLSWLVERGGRLEAKGSETCTGFLALATKDPTSVEDQDILLTAQIISKTGEDTNSRQSQLKTPLMLAASNGNLGLVEFLCKNGAELDLKDSQGWTAVMFGADSRHGHVVRFLLEAGADPDSISFNGQTAADLATQQRTSVLLRIIEEYSRMRGLKVERNPLHERKRTEMDGILIGLDAEQYKEVFAKHSIGVPEFVTLSEGDLVDLGVDCVGARKRLLDGQRAVHQKSWNKSSMPSLNIEDMHAGLRLTCPGAAGVLGNLSNHLVYLKANVGYIRLQARDFGPRFMLAGSDVVDPAQLLQLLATCRDRMHTLDRECNLLSNELVLLGAGSVNPNPVDSVVPNQNYGYTKLAACLAALPIFALAFSKLL